MTRQEKLAELKREMCVLWNTMKRCGNKHPEEHYMIKSYMKDIRELERRNYESISNDN